MATYDKQIDYDNERTFYNLKERHIYGSSRVGVRSSDVDLLALQSQIFSMQSVHYSIGSRTYELSNHLGNVLSVISDNVIPYFDGGGGIAEMRADIRVAQDYSPFGVTLSGRDFSVSEGYRYGFQGQEMDDEVKGDGNSVNYKYRMHDPRIGRFFAVDPLSKDYPHYSPYSFSGNEVIRKVELEGLEPADYLLKQSNVGKSFIAVSNANGQEGKKYYWKLQSFANSIYWEQTKRYEAPKPKQATPESPDDIKRMEERWASAVRLENTLNSYANEALSNGSYGNFLYYKLSAWSSGLEGDVGFKRKGIPLIASTAGTVLTFGSGSIVTGGVASGAANGTGNLIGQWAQTGDISQVDIGSVGLATGGGLLRNPWVSTAVTSTLDAALDVKLDGTVNTIGTSNKSWSQGAVDLGFGLIGGSQNNLLQKSGVNQNILKTRTLTIGAGQTYLNGEANKKQDKK